MTDEDGFEIARQKDCCGLVGLENWRSAAHICRMVDKFRARLLEVEVRPVKPDRWEWRVCEGDMLVMTGFETSRETAQIEGDSALFRLLSTGTR